MSDTFTIALPAELRDVLDAEARAHGFSDVSTYIAALVRANCGATDEHPDVEAAILDGIASGPAVTTDDAFWSTVSQRARDAAKRSSAE